MNNKNIIFDQKLKKIHSENIIRLDNYINNNTKINFKCNICNNIWKTSPMTLVRSKKPTGCPNCNKLKRNIQFTNTKEFKNFVKKQTNLEYIVLGNYKNNSTKIKMLHDKCNKEYYVRPNDFQQGYRCPYCSHGHSLKSNEAFKEDVRKQVGDEYKVIGRYLGCEKHIKMLHVKCNQEFNVKPTNFLSNKTRCPYCMESCLPHQSKKMDYIESQLKKMNIDYNKEVTIKGCKYKRLLKFDYYLPKLDLYLEFDGVQHFRETKKIKNTNFLDVRKRDNIKNSFCKENFKNLLRLDDKNYRKINLILEDIKNKRSTTIEKYDVYIISDYLIHDNGKYLVE